MRNHCEIAKPATALRLCEKPNPSSQPRAITKRAYIHLTTWDNPRQIFDDAEAPLDEIARREEERGRRETTLIDRLLRAYDAFMHPRHPDGGTLRRSLRA
jgi:hypothetical protein